MATTLRPRFDKAEKLFLIACVSLTGAFLSVLLWWGSINELPKLQIPTQKPLAGNAFGTFVQAARWAVAPPRKPPLDPLFPFIDPKNVPRKDWPKVYPLWRKKAWLGSNALALKTLRAGLPYPYQFPSDPAAQFNFMGYRGYYYLASALRIEGDLRAARGDWKGAAQSALDGIQFGIKTQNGAGTSLRQLKSMQARLDSTTCRIAARKLSQWRSEEQPYWQRIQNQKYFWQLMLLDTLRQRDWAARLMQQGGLTASYWWDVMPVQFQGKKRVFNELTRYFDARIAAAKKPYTTAPQVENPDGIAGGWLRGWGSDGSLERFRHASIETRTALLTVALALRAYQLDHGTYPEKLAQLIPTYLPQIPADPFGGGEALHYRKQSGAYVLWSIGPDKKDNGGQPVMRKSPTGYDSSQHDVFGDAAEIEVDFTSLGDWVYGKNR